MTRKKGHRPPAVLHVFPLKHNVYKGFTDFPLTAPPPKEYIGKNKFVRSIMKKKTPFSPAGVCTGRPPSSTPTRPTTLITEPKGSGPVHPPVPGRCPYAWMTVISVTGSPSQVTDTGPSPGISRSRSPYSSLWKRVISIRQPSPCRAGQRPEPSPGALTPRYPNHPRYFI